MKDISVSGSRQNRVPWRSHAALQGPINRPTHEIRAVPAQKLLRTAQPSSLGLKSDRLLALSIATLLSGFLAFYSVRLTWQSWDIEDISVGIDATPMWIPQIFMALGTVIFFIALLDDLVLELQGKRQSAVNEDAHHE